MDGIDQETGSAPQSQSKRVGNLIGWIVGLVFLLLGLEVLQTSRGYPPTISTATIAILAGIFILPPVTAALAKRIKLLRRRSVPPLVFVALVILIPLTSNALQPSGATRTRYITQATADAEAHLKNHDVGAAQEDLAPFSSDGARNPALKAIQAKVSEAQAALSKSGQSSSSNAPDTSQSIGRPATEQQFLDSRELSDDDRSREKNAPNSIALARIDWEIQAKDCRSLHKWRNFTDWTGRIEDMEDGNRAIKLKIDLNNNGRTMSYLQLYGDVANKSALHDVIIKLKEGGSTGSPVVVSGRFALPPIRSALAYSPDDYDKKLALSFCSGMTDIPVTFTSVRPVNDIVEDR